MVASLYSQLLSHSSAAEQLASPTTRRRLMFTNKIFQGEAFYLDLRTTSGCRARPQLEEDLHVLGGRVEAFLSKDVTHMITDKQDCSTASSSPAAAGSRPARGGKSSPAVYSRAQALLNRSKHKQEQKSNASDPIALAKQMRIRIISLQKVLNIIEKEKGKCDPSRKLSSGRHASKAAFKSRKLEGAFIKVEDLSGLYRPSAKNFPSFPVIDLFNPDIDHNQSPFVAKKKKAYVTEGNPGKDKCASMTQHEAKKPAARVGKAAQPKPDIPNAVLTPRAAAPTPKDGAKPKAQAGYCESCDKSYQCLREHIMSDAHIKFAQNHKNFSDLDTVVSSLPTLEQLLNSLQVSSPVATRSEPYEEEEAAVGETLMELGEGAISEADKGLVTPIKVEKSSQSDQTDAPHPICDTPVSACHVPHTMAIALPGPPRLQDVPSNVSSNDATMPYMGPAPQTSQSEKVLTMPYSQASQPQETSQASQESSQDEKDQTLPYEQEEEEACGGGTSQSDKDRTLPYEDQCLCHVSSQEEDFVYNQQNVSVTANTSFSQDNKAAVQAAIHSTCTAAAQAAIHSTYTEHTHTHVSHQEVAAKPTADMCEADVKPNIADLQASVCSTAAQQVDIKPSIQHMEDKAIIGSIHPVSPAAPCAAPATAATCATPATAAPCAAPATAAPCAPATAGGEDTKPFSAGVPGQASDVSLPGCRQVLLPNSHTSVHTCEAGHVSSASVSDPLSASSHPDLTHSKTSHIDTTTSQIETRTSQRETRTSQRETRTCQRETRTSQRETRTSHIETGTSQRETRSSQIEARTSQRETRTSQRHQLSDKINADVQIKQENSSSNMAGVVSFVHGLGEMDGLQDSMSHVVVIPSESNDATLQEPFSSRGDHFDVSPVKILSQFPFNFTETRSEQSQDTTPTVYSSHLPPNSRLGDESSTRASFSGYNLSSGNYSNMSLGVGGVGSVSSVHTSALTALSLPHQPSSGAADTGAPAGVVDACRMNEACLPTTSEPSLYPTSFSNILSNLSSTGSLTFHQPLSAAAPPVSTPHQVAAQEEEDMECSAASSDAVENSIAMNLMAKLQNQDFNSSASGSESDAFLNLNQAPSSFDLDSIDLVANKMADLDEVLSRESMVGNSHQTTNIVFPLDGGQMHTDSRSRESMVGNSHQTTNLVFPLDGGHMHTDSQSSVLPPPVYGCQVPAAQTHMQQPAFAHISIVQPQPLSTSGRLSSAPSSSNPTPSPAPSPYHSQNPSPSPYHSAAPSPSPYHSLNPNPSPYHSAAPSPYHNQNQNPSPYQSQNYNPGSYHSQNPTPGPNPNPCPSYSPSPTPCFTPPSSPPPQPHQEPAGLPSGSELVPEAMCIPSESEPESEPEQIPEAAGISSESESERGPEAAGIPSESESERGPEAAGIPSESEPESERGPEAAGIPSESEPESEQGPEVNMKENTAPSVFDLQQHNLSLVSFADLAKSAQTLPPFHAGQQLTGGGWTQPPFHASQQLTGGGGGWTLPPFHTGQQVTGGGGWFSQLTSAPTFASLCQNEPVRLFADCPSAESGAPGQRPWSPSLVLNKPVAPSPVHEEARDRVVGTIADGPYISPVKSKVVSSKYKKVKSKSEKKKKKGKDETNCRDMPHNTANIDTSSSKVKTSKKSKTADKPMNLTDSVVSGNMQPVALESDVKAKKHKKKSRSKEKSRRCKHKESSVELASPMSTSRVENQATPGRPTPSRHTTDQPTPGRHTTDQPTPGRHTTDQDSVWVSTPSRGLKLKLCRRVATPSATSSKEPSVCEAAGGAAPDVVAIEPEKPKSAKSKRHDKKKLEKSSRRRKLEYNL